MFEQLSRRIRRTACPLPQPKSQRVCLRPHHFLPLVGFLLPSATLGYGFVLPRSCAAGLNELSVGFATTLVGAAVTYIVGVLAASRR